MDSVFLDWMIFKLIAVSVVFFIAGFMGWLD